jgi:hypothetical protein
MISAFFGALGVILAIAFVAVAAIFVIVKFILAIIGGTAGGIVNAFDKVRKK